VNANGECGDDEAIKAFDAVLLEGGLSNVTSRPDSTGKNVSWLVDRFDHRHNIISNFN
jgi:hypothetical protein